MKEKEKALKLKKQIFIGVAIIVISAVVGAGFAVAGADGANSQPDEAAVRAYEAYRQIFDKVHRMQNPAAMLGEKTALDVSVHVVSRDTGLPDTDRLGRAKLIDDGRSATIAHFLTIDMEDHDTWESESYYITGDDNFIQIRQDESGNFYSVDFIEAQGFYDIFANLYRLNEEYPEYYEFFDWHIQFFWLQCRFALPDLSVRDIISAEFEENEDEVIINMVLNGQSCDLRNFYIRPGDTGDRQRWHTLHDIHMTIVTSAFGVPESLSFETQVSRRLRDNTINPGIRLEREIRTLIFNAFDDDVEIVLPEI